MMELIKEKRVRQYELTTLLPSALTSAEVTNTKDAIEKLLKKNSVTVLSQEDWGKKEMAYPIKYKSVKQYEAFYTHMVLEADASDIHVFEKDLYLQPSVMRHLLVLAEKESSNLEDLKTQREE